MRRNRTGLLVLFLLLSGREAPAAVASRVVLLQTPANDPLTDQGNTLLAAELRAAGFEVTLVMRNPARELGQDIEATSAALSPIATFAIRPAPDGASVELWLADRVTGKLTIRRIVVDRGREGAADLAVRAIELLRGSLVEVVLPAPASGARPSAPDDVTRWVSTAVHERPLYFSNGPGVAAGAGELASSGLGATFTPVVRLTWGTRRGWMARLSLAALGQGHDLRRPEGSAEIHQEILLIEGGRVFRPLARLQSFVVAGAGVRRLRIDGAGSSPLFPGTASTAHATAVAAGGGVALRLADRVALVVDAQLLVMLPTTRVLIASSEAGRAGPWGLLGTLTVIATF